jgi:hypothetical protein
MEIGSQAKLVAALVAGTVSVGAAAVGVAQATTGPAPHTLVNVSLNDTTIKLSKSRVADVTFVDFYIHNTGKLAHTMVVGIQKSVTVRPGARLHFYVGFPVYGWYRYHVGLHGKPRQKGRFHVDSPQPPD